MASIDFIKDLPNLKFFSFVNTNILDGNIRPALGLSYIGFNDKKHYSHKWKDVKKENHDKINK